MINHSKIEKDLKGVKRSLRRHSKVGDLRLPLRSTLCDYYAAIKELDKQIKNIKKYLKKRDRGVYRLKLLHRINGPRKRKDVA